MVIFALSNGNIGMFYKNHKQLFDILILTVFWIAVSILFLTTSLIRPYCAYHPFKELICVLLIAAVSVITRRITYPQLFLNNKHTAFWIVTFTLLLLSAFAELWLVISELSTTNSHLHKIDGYTFTLFSSVLLRNAALLGCTLLPILLSHLKSHPKTKEVVPSNDDSASTNENSFSTNQNFVHTHEDKNDSKPPSSDNATTPQSDIEQIPNVLDPQLQYVLEVITTHPLCNSQLIADQIHYGLSKRTVERYINQLKDMGLIERVGGNRNGGYRVVEKKDDSLESAETR
jgi:hypothetical protein